MFNKNNKGFTILEVIIAIFFLTIGLGSAFGVIHKILSFSSINNSRLIAASLSQEGIEIVKNIRDTNYIQEEVWDNGIDLGDYEADYNDTGLVNNDRYLQIDADSGFYSYDSGVDSRFKRKITISDKEDLDNPLDGIPDRLKIEVIVEWDEKSGTNSFTAYEYIYDWK